MFRRVIITAAVFFAPAFVSAAPYFEFAPDYSEPLAVSAGTTVSQIFAPLNDRLSVIELWVSTGGSTAGLDVTLTDQSGTVVATRTVSLTAIPDSDGGTRTKLTLPSQIAVTGGEPYRLDIEPFGAPVKLYRSTSVSIVPGSGSDSSVSYRYGRAIVNGEEQGYSFKFALTEAAETTAPVASEVVVLQPAIGQAMLSFRASEPVDVQVTYGSRTVPWTGQFNPCLPGIIVCNIYLPVTPGITYAYSMTLKDAWGNTSITQGSFTAVGQGPADSTATPTPSAVPSGAPPPSSSTLMPTQTAPAPVNDKTPPVISSPRLLGVSPMSATVAWSTDEGADSSVIMVGEGIYAFDATLEMEHYMTISGLSPDWYYRMRVSSSDYWGNYSDVLIIFVTPLTDTPTTSTVVGPPGSSPTVTPSPTPSYTVVIPPSQLPPPTTPPPSSASPTASPTSSTVTPPTASPTVGASASPATSPTPSVVAYPSTSTAPGEIHWPPADGDYDGYRIDIFDEFGNLITTLTAGKDATSIQLPAGIGNGARVIVYADRGGAFEKVGMTTVTDRPPETTGLSYTTSIVIIGAGVVFLAGLIGAWVWERRRQKVAVSAETVIGLGGGPQAGR